MDKASRVARRGTARGGGGAVPLFPSLPPPLSSTPLSFPPRAVPPVRPDPTRVDDDDARDARRLAFARRRRASRRDAAAADRAAARAAADARWDRVDETAAVDADERRRRRSSDASVSTTTETTDSLASDVAAEAVEQAPTETDDVTVKPGGMSWSSPARPRARAVAVDDAAAKAAEAAAVERVKVASGGVAWHSPARAERPSKLAAARMRRDAAKAEAAAAAARANASIDASSLERKSAATTMKHLIDTRKPSRIQHLPRCPDITRSRLAEASDVYDRETHDRLAKAAFGDRRD